MSNHVKFTQEMVQEINRGVTAVHLLCREKGWWDTPEHISTLSRCLDDMNQPMSNELADAIRVVIQQPVRNKGELIALIHSEASECLEGLRKFNEDGTPLRDDHCPDLTMEAAEMADIVIRVFDYCGAHGINLGRAIAMKHDFNATRPHKHGKKF